MAHLTKEIKDLKNLFDSKMISEEKKESFQKIVDYLETPVAKPEIVTLSFGEYDIKEFSRECHDNNINILTNLKENKKKNFCLMYYLYDKKYNVIVVESKIYNVTGNNYCNRLILYISPEAICFLSKVFPDWKNECNYEELIRIIRNNKDKFKDFDIKIAVFNPNLTLSEQHKLSIYEYPKVFFADGSINDDDKSHYNKKTRDYISEFMLNPKLDLSDK